MQLIEIDKDRYKKHYWVVFAIITIALIIISLSSSTLLIQFFSTPDEDNFWYNLAGVVFAAIVVAISLNKSRHHPYMFEVIYVWELKQQLNRIYRKQNKIQPHIKNNDSNAMIIMNFFYRGSKQLYELDDNTITMDVLKVNIQELDERMEGLGMSLSTDAYDPVMLESFN